jgi:hypothetical protein
MKLKLRLDTGITPVMAHRQAKTAMRTIQEHSLRKYEFTRDFCLIAARTLVRCGSRKEFYGCGESQENAMKIALRLKVDEDADRAVRDWLATRPKTKIIKRYPVERLPLQMMSVRPFRRLDAMDQYSVLIEYEET